MDEHLKQTLEDAKVEAERHLLRYFVLIDFRAIGSGMAYFDTFKSDDYAMEDLERGCASGSPGWVYAKDGDGNWIVWAHRNIPWMAENYSDNEGEERPQIQIKRSPNLFKYITDNRVALQIISSMELDSQRSMLNQWNRHAVLRQLADRLWDWMLQDTEIANWAHDRAFEELCISEDAPKEEIDRRLPEIQNQVSLAMRGLLSYIVYANTIG